MEASSILGGQLVLIVRSEFKKLICDSTFTKQPEGMSFVNVELELGTQPKCYADRLPFSRGKTALIPRRGLKLRLCEGTKGSWTR